jgi:hypothetical protein
MVKVTISVLAALLLLAAAVRGTELPPRKLENSRELEDERELQQETDAPSAAPEQPNLTREYTQNRQLFSRC